MHILGISGSLRKGSYNTSLLRAALNELPPEVSSETFDIGTLPLMNADLEAELPAPVQALKTAIAKADAVLIASPEYNYSIPGVLKNALDWGSRPYGHNTWKGKPVAILGGSTGGFGTVRMQPHLKYVLSNLSMHVLYQPEVQISAVDKKIDAAGNLTDEETRKKLHEQMEALLKWIERMK